MYPLLGGISPTLQVESLNPLLGGISVSSAGGIHVQYALLGGISPPFLVESLYPLLGGISVYSPDGIHVSSPEWYLPILFWVRYTGGGDRIQLRNRMGGVPKFLLLQQLSGILKKIDVKICFNIENVWTR